MNFFFFFFLTVHIHTRRFIYVSRFTDEQTCNKKVIKTVLGKAVSNEPQPRAFHIPMFWITAVVPEIFLFEARAVVGRENYCITKNMHYLS